MPAEITRRCGHVETVKNIELDFADARGDANNAERTKEQAALCTACAVATFGELPALTGTDKQAAWASDIRASRLADLLNACPGAVVDAVRDDLIGRTDAPWWIRQRGNTGRTLARQILGAARLIDLETSAR